jgi:predicted metal-binding membrane protein
MFVLAAWAGLMLMTASPLPGMTAAEYWAALCVSAENANPLALFGMWALMSAAMMLPTFVPAIRVFGELSTIRATNSASMMALSFGYSVIWLVFSAFAAGLQYAFANAGIVSAAGEILSPWLAAGLLAASGLYQFSPVKEACLAKCRQPLIFFMEHWAPGLKPAFNMGARLGIWCVGCCWMLMLLGFVGGTMNLLWMGAATLFMVLEKLQDIGRYLTKPLGTALILGAIFQLWSAYSLGG